MKLRIAFCIPIVGVLLFSLSAHSHGGRTDKFGCHQVSETKEYHCHNGPNKGKKFDKKADAKGLKEKPKKVDQKAENKKMSRDKASE